MIIKSATFAGITKSGEPLVQVFHPEDSITKVAGRMMPEVQDWLSTYKSDKKHIAVLINALGASEYYGQNSNGDYFSWAALTHDCRLHRGRPHAIDSFTGKIIPAHGYWTFLNAHAFAHHKNKDPNRAFGDVVLSVLNHKMKRVELVVILDRDNAEKFGGSLALERILAGEYPSTSMGCKVPYDVCLICGNKSKTRHDYCDCVKKTGMGRILPDGRRVGVDNPHPRFFDISFVFRGADKTSKMMSKLANYSEVPPSVAEADMLYGPDGELIRHIPAIQDGAGSGCYGGACTIKSAAVRVGPPPKRNRKEYPFVGTVNFRGLTIHVENKAGSVRKGKGPNGKEWSTFMHYTYGEILGTKGTDGDKLDVYVGPNKKAKDVYIVHQNHPGTHPTKAGKFDEDKVMLGFNSPEEAKEAYLKQYDRKDFFRSLTIMPFTTFKDKIMTEVHGEKVASVDKGLLDLFGPGARVRERRWTDSSTGKSVTVKGSGLNKTAALIPKHASKKTAEQRKWAQIIKRVDPKGAGSGYVMSRLEEREPDLPKDILNTMGLRGMNAASALGMVLKPREFQRVVLCHGGRPDIADDLDRDRLTFLDSGAARPIPGMGLGINHRILRMLMPFLAHRSMYGPVLGRRMARITITMPIDHGHYRRVRSPLLDGIAGQYNTYRGNMLKVASYADDHIAQYPDLRAGIYGIESEDDLFKQAVDTAAVSSAVKSATTDKLRGLAILAILGMIPATYMYSIHKSNDRARGKLLGPLDSFVADHPYAASLGTAAGIKQLMRAEIGQTALKAAKGVV